MKRRFPRGFSLIEVLATMAIVALLAAIALPSYAVYMANARRGSGRTALVQAALWLERAATANGAYPDASFVPPGLLRSDGDSYRLIASTTPISFRLEAIPSGSQTGDRCGTLALLHSGERTISNAPSDATADACWSR
jgi:type IV pilus assembly protein PilE